MSDETEQAFSNATTASNDKAIQKGRLVVLAGPSAVGKSTVVQRLRELVPNLYFSVSVTTREPRPGEVDGRDYFFVSKREFQRYIDDHKLLEWADIHGGLQRSGTPREPVEQALREGRPVLIEVDLAGARQIRHSMPAAQLVFLAPPSMQTLVDRLYQRATESEDIIQLRLHTAVTELEAQSEFDRIIVNDDLDKAVSELMSCWGITAP